MTLYDIGIEGMLIASILTECEGELTPDVEQRIDELMRKAPSRVEAAAMVVRQMEADAQTCREEARRLAERAKGFEQNAEQLKKLMVVAVDAAFSGKVKTARFTIWTQKAADSVKFSLAEEFTIDMLHEDRPDLVRVTKELENAALQVHYKTDKVAIPDAINIEEKTGERYIRIK